MPEPIDLDAASHLSPRPSPLAPPARSSDPGPADEDEADPDLLLLRAIFDGPLFS